MAELRTPSMPLAPRLQPTRPSRPRIEDPELKDLPGEELVAYISASRMGILFPRNSADPGDSVSITIRATKGLLVIGVVKNDRMEEVPLMLECSP
jgi:hypothetical protein